LYGARMALGGQHGRIAEACGQLAIHRPHGCCIEIADQHAAAMRSRSEVAQQSAQLAGALRQRAHTWDPVRCAYVHVQQFELQARTGGPFATDLGDAGIAMRQFEAPQTRRLAQCDAHPGVVRSGSSIPCGNTRARASACSGESSCVATASASSRSTRLANASGSAPPFQRLADTMRKGRSAPDGGRSPRCVTVSIQ
jgi:hypothetical protein